MTATIHHGDCLDVLRQMPDNSVHAIVTDPPYGLANTTPDQVAETIVKWVSGERDYLPSRPRKGRKNCLTQILRRSEGDVFDAQAEAGGDLVNLSVSFDPVLTAMLRSVNLDNEAAFREEEVNDVSADLALDDVLVNDLLANFGERGQDVQFRLRAGKGSTGCVGECACFAELSHSRVSVGVRLGYYALAQAEGATPVVTLRTTEVGAMLALDVRRGTLELTPATGALHEDAPTILLSPKGVGAGSGAGGLAPMAESGDVGGVGVAADGAIALDLLAHADLLDRFSRPKDTPVGFMGKAWDGFVPPVAVWDEAMRVLKPGGHVLAFAGTRTVDLMTLGLRLAGFDIRENLAWMYGSGMPKSHNVSKAIDKAAGAQRQTKKWIGREKVMDGRPFGDREVTATSGNLQCPECGKWKFAPDYCKCPRDSGPATDAAKQWEGWGSALKPATEPIVMARKPFKGTLAANVLEHGTGAINVDACRIATDDDLNGGAYTGGRKGRAMAPGGAHRNVADLGEYAAPSGRWPANVILDEHMAGMLDEQSGDVKGAVSNGNKAGNGYHGNFGPIPQKPGYNDSGGASRFFYVAKASKRERPDVDGIKHPTVKPLALMQWLVRLVTPPNGIVLDPFAGSGTTVEAAMLEGFQVIGIEREAEYLPLIHERIRRATEQLATEDPEQGSFSFEETA